MISFDVLFFRLFYAGRNTGFARAYSLHSIQKRTVTFPSPKTESSSSFEVFPIRASLVKSQVF